MRKFRLTTDMVNGQIIYTYNENGFLVGIYVEGGYTERTIRFFFNTAPFSIEELKNMPLVNKTIKEIV